MISIRHALTVPHRSLATLLLIPALTLAACGGADESEDDAASAGDDTAPVSQDDAPDSDEAAAPEDDAAEAEDSAGEDDGDDPGEPGGSFCDQFAEFLDAWAADELTPADLTAEYEALGTSAPDELVEPFEILAEGNEAALAGESPPEEYDAAGQTMADYARDQCGLTAPW